MPAFVRLHVLHGRPAAASGAEEGLALSLCRTIGATLRHERMFSRHSIIYFWLALVSAGPAVAISAQQERPADPREGTPECVKKVFDRFCLGGPIPEGYDRLEEGAYIYEKDGEPPVIVGAFKERIVRVSRLYRPDGWDVYRDLLARLRARYGPGEDRSTYPEYATDDYKREIAIGAQRGEALHYWDEGEWFLMLLWSRRGGITVTYVHGALEYELGQSPPPEDDL